MNKLLESNAVVDSKLRQRVTIEAIGTNNAAASTEVNATIPVSGTVTATANVNISSGSAQLVAVSSANPYSLTNQVVGNIMEGPVHQLWRVANDAQACYASAIRSKLTFS
jgi:hypothetical protein